MAFQRRGVSHHETVPRAVEDIFSVVKAAAAIVMIDALPRAAGIVPCRTQ